MAASITKLFNHFKKIEGATNVLLHSMVIPRSPWTDAAKLLDNADLFDNMELLSSDMINMFKEKLNRLKKLNSPILKKAKDVFLKNDTYKYGLIVLLLGKTALDSSFHSSKDISVKHKTLAETTELLRRAHFFHKGLTSITNSSELATDWQHLNKLSIHIGDFLYTKAFIHLASMQNSDVLEAMFAATRDMAEAEMLRMLDNNFNLLPAEPDISKPDNAISSENSRIRAPYQIDQILGNARDEWFLRNLLNNGNLLGLACQCALILSECDEDVIEQGYFFGQNVALALQAQSQYDLFVKKQFNQATLVSAPVLLHLYKQPAFYEQLMDIVNVNNTCDYDIVWEIVRIGDGLNDTLFLKELLRKRALKNLTYFNNNAEKDILSNIINNI